MVVGDHNRANVSHQIDNSDNHKTYTVRRYRKLFKRLVPHVLDPQKIRE